MQIAIMIDVTVDDIIDLIIATIMLVLAFGHPVICKIRADKDTYFCGKIRTR